MAVKRKELTGGQEAQGAAAHPERTAALKHASPVPGLSLVKKRGAPGIAAARALMCSNAAFGLGDGAAEQPLTPATRTGQPGAHEVPAKIAGFAHCGPSLFHRRPAQAGSAGRALS